MKSTTERPKNKQLNTAIAIALAFGASVVMTSHARESEADSTQDLDIDVVVVETPSAGQLPSEIPDVGQLPEEIEPLPVLPGDVALDSEGNAYPDGGPAGLYNAIVDKQQKLGMTVDADGIVTYEGSNPGHQTALARLRENLERKLNKEGLLDDAPSTGQLPSEIPDVGQSPDENVEPLPVLPKDVALDSEGNAYEEGGPAGLYNAITDKQQKLGMTVDADGNVTYEGSNPGHQTALARLRENLERKLKKLGLFDDTPTVEGLATSSELGIASNRARTGKTKIDRSKKPEQSAKLEKVTRVAKVEKVEKVSKPARVERVERPQKPTKISRVERPQRPEKISRVEKPQRPEKPQKPQKPQKPEKPERPGRS